ncbi:MAG: ABC transporter ATP-binding protein [Planctomycetota bacterium]|jgi:iron(III) transport system ATP-binding protein|nr:ABC transporter ATP-binding protein [Planctomycetota bacterium]
MSEPEDALLHVTGLGHHFGTTPVIDSVSFTCSRGELLAVLGASGCGKTTILRAIAGLLSPTAGRIVLGDTTLCADGTCSVPVEQRGIGLVFQDYALFPGLDVRGNVAFGLRRSERARADELLRMVGLAEFSKRRTTELSGGQQQRVALARALAPQPQLLLMDEPFANVDASMRDELGPELRALLKDTGTSALLVTHDRHEALGLADRVVVLQPGAAGATVAQCATPIEVYQQPATRAVAELTGPVACIAGEANGLQVETDLGDWPLRRDLKDEVLVLARPEELRFVPDSYGPATVRSHRFMGHALRVLCTTPVGTIHVDVPVHQAPSEGDCGRIEARRGLWAVSP